MTKPCPGLRTALFLAGLATLVACGRTGTEPATATDGVRDESATTAEALSQALIARSTDYERASPNARGRARADLLDVAARRHDVLAGLIENDPSTVLRVTLPGTVRAGMPEEVRARLEQRVDLEGELEVVYEDYRDGSARLRHVLKANGERISLHFAADPPGLLSGTPVRASGVRLDDAMALESGQSVLTLAARGGATGGSNGGTPAPAPSALGEQRTLLILVNFADAPTQPYTLEDARSVMFDTTSQFFLENSSQQTWLTGDVVGWFTIAASSTACDTAAIASQAESAASAAGTDLAAYTRRVYAFPQNSACGWWGLSTLGGSPSQTWITGDFELGVTAHELGHGLGLFHSHSLDCGATTLGASCTAIEYGNMLDMMGSSASGHFNAFEKERLGWLNSRAPTVSPITTVETDGTYALGPYALAGQSPKALKILKSTDPSTGRRTWYYVEARQPIGFDSYLATYPNVLSGVLIHYGTESNGNSSHLLDATPQSGSTIALDWRDPALVVGQTFHDPVAGVTLTTDSVTSTGATVTVRFDETMAISTDQSSYTRSEAVSINAKVRSGSGPVANANVTFTVTKSNGIVLTGRATTGTDGTATFKLRLRRDDPVGTYQAGGVADGIGTPGAATSFLVR